MDLQFIVVSVIVLSAIAFAALTLARKTRSFSTKSDCGADCGCGDAKEKLTSSKV
jgi:hypothetical protein